MFSRYALYHAPATGSALARLGAAWLGRDAEGQAAAPPLAPVPPDLPGCRPMAALTASPRRYGLHATLKPPMRLADGQSEAALLDAVGRWAAARRPVDLGPLRIAGLGAFLAFVPVDQPRALTDLAADLVRDLDPFRAPPAEAELARRRAQGLTARQEELLSRWGYPYVMEEFGFHITLTDRLDQSEIAPVRAAAEAHFAEVGGRALRLTDIAVFGEDAAGMFHLIARVPLGG